MNNEKIMVVEDEWIVADLICRNIRDYGYTVCSTATTGDEAIKNAVEERPDLILMDIVLKDKMDGIEAAARIHSHFFVPVIYLTAYTNQEYIERAKLTKPYSYLIKPYNKEELYANIALALHKYKADKEIKDYLDRLKKCYTGIMKAFSGAIELRGPYAPGHHRRVAEFTHAIAKEMGLSDSSLERLWLAAHVYDISLAIIPAEIILNAGRLTGPNLALYRNYPQSSYDILKEANFPCPIAEIARQHCECLDGSGFPQGIKGVDILIEARILAVAHSLEDLTSHRVFRNSFSLDEALEEISAHSGSKYDSEVVAACLRALNKMKK